MLFFYIWTYSKIQFEFRWYFRISNITIQKHILFQLGQLIWTNGSVFLGLHFVMKHIIKIHEIYIIIYPGGRCKSLILHGDCIPDLRDLTQAFSVWALHSVCNHSFSEVKHAFFCFHTMWSETNYNDEFQHLIQLDWIRVK